MECHLITYPTWERYNVLAHVITELTIKERRQIFQLSRAVRPYFSPDLFFPQYGFSLGEFAVWYTLGDHRKKVRPCKKKKPQHQS